MAEVITVGDLPGEVWKDIKGWKGYYQVSNKGRVKSMARVIMRDTGVQMTLRERILKPHKGIQVNLSRPDKAEQGHIHVLVAKAFLPPKPPGADRVCHRDDDHANNVPSNLYWGDASTNGKDAYRNGRHSGKVMPKGGDVYNATPIKTINKIRTLRAKGLPYTAIAEKVGSNYTTVFQCVNKRGRFKDT